MMSLTEKSKLLEDYILTANILIDTASDSPLAVFYNYQGDAEVLAICADHHLYHIYRDILTDSGWNLKEVSTNTIKEVVAGVDSDGKVYAFFTDDESLYQTSLNTDGKWSLPTKLNVCSSLQATNIPILNQLIVYGVTSDGNLQLVRSSGGKWSTASVDFEKNLMSTKPLLKMTDARNWSLAAAINGELTLYTGEDTAVASGPYNTKLPCDKILVAYERENSIMFMFTDAKSNLYTNVHFSDTATQIPNSLVEYGAGLKDTDGMLHFYGINPDGVLWVLHQTTWTTEGPVWAPNIPMDTNVIRIASCNNQQDFTDIFGVGDDGSLHYLFKDRTAQVWNRLQIQQPHDEPYHIISYSSRVTIQDENGNPKPNVSVTIKSDSEIALWIAGKTYHVNPDQPANVKTNAMGTLTISTPSRGLNTPKIVLSAENLPETTINPASELHAYLSGKGTLNYLPQFSGETLQNATVDGKPLAPGITADMATAAAQGIMSAVQSHPDTCLHTADAGAGWALDLTDPENPSFRTFSTTEELETYKVNLFNMINTETELLGSFWDDIKKFAEDVWNGIKSAAIKVEHWVVDTAKKVVSFAVKFGEELHQLVDMAIKGVEDVVSIVQSIFTAIKAFIEKVIEWLKAFFSWKDIWDTKKALQSTLPKIGPYVKEVIEEQAEQLLDGFFSKLEGEVRDGFTALKGKFTQKESLKDLIPGSQTFKSPLLAGVTSLDIHDFSGGVQNNWLIEKVLSYLTEAPDLKSLTDLEKPLEDLGNAVTSALSELGVAIEDFEQFMVETVTDPKEFGSLLIIEFLDAMEHLVLAALKFADGVIKAFLDTIVVVIEGIDNLLTAPLEIPLVTDLIHLIEKLLGLPQEEVSIAELFCLIAAIPLTLVYKLIHGADAKLFPGGIIPDTDAIMLKDTPEAIKFTHVGILAIWALFNSVMDCFAGEEEKSPFALKVISIIFLLLNRVFGWPTGIPFTKIPLKTRADKVNFSNWIIGFSVPLLNIALMLVPKIPFNPGRKRTIARYLDPVGLSILTGIGCIWFIIGVLSSTLGDVSKGMIAYNTLFPLPVATQLLRKKEFIEETEGVTLVIKICVDFFAGEGAAVATAAA
ncbi:MAG: hypothetical protein HXS44_01475 [Theionarchaea archaeon]|nr:hypothetical protein [Theionarchaea archaeon]